MATVDIQYFAQLKDAAKASGEVWTLEREDTPQSIYAKLKETHGFVLESSELRVAINDEFGSMTQTLSAGDKITFIPPVSGG